jgi:hypothetical protein
MQLAKKERQARRGELVESRETSRGKGLFARVDFRPNELICGLVGNEERLRGTPAELDALVQGRPEINDYCANGPDGTFLVPKDTTALGWHLANHSCNPNAKLWTEKGEGLKARLAIAAGSEITAWYGWSKREVVCLCGEPNCTGWIGLPFRVMANGSYSWLDEDVRALLRSATAVKNDEAVQTVVKALRSAGKDDAYLRAYFANVFGQIDGVALVEKALGAYSATQLR